MGVTICRLLCVTIETTMFMWYPPGVLWHGLPWLVQHRWQPRGAGDHCSPTDQWHQRVAALPSGKYLLEYLVYVHIVHSDGTGSCIYWPSSVTIRVCDRHGQPAGDWMITLGIQLWFSGPVLTTQTTNGVHCAGANVVCQASLHIGYRGSWEDWTGPRC